MMKLFRKKPVSIEIVPEQMAEATVTFHGGEVKVYRISERPGLGRFYNVDARLDCVLLLRDKDRHVGIPLANIREWAVEPVLSVGGIRAVQENRA